MTRLVTSDEQVMADASAWLARLQRDEVTESDGLAFEAWLAESPAHAAAYRRALATWQEFESCADEVLAALAADAARPVHRPSATRRWLMGAGGGAIAAGLAVAILPGLLAQPEGQSYSTAKGQHRKITLADGSIVDLNAETRLTVRFTHGERHVELADGQAIFDVTHDKARPFTVAASDRVIRVVGTQFDVRARGGLLSVSVAQGKVQVRPASDAVAGHDYMLTPGQRLEVGRTGVETLKAINPAEALGWRAGRLVYRAAPLAEVVADVNRQFVQQIEISDPDLARTPVTGVIILDDQAAVISRLSLMLPVRSIPSERGVLLLRK